VVAPRNRIGFIFPPGESRRASFPGQAECLPRLHFAGGFDALYFLPNCSRSCFSAASTSISPLPSAQRALTTS
jgi:hypothetical protein